MQKNTISFVIPCLNEAKTLPTVLQKIKNVIKNELQDREVEILISDNGSTDKSVEIALSFGANVSHCPKKGYGEALKNGLTKAKGSILIWADADDTYNFNESYKLIQKLESEKLDLVIGSRFHGKIHKGAMPFLHRYLGTPVLNFLINILFDFKKRRASDCNSGFRCIRKATFLKLNIKSGGMEFTTTMVVRALKQNAAIGTVPIDLHPDLKGRTPHLKTWRDGMRHLIQILAEAPLFFERLGILLFTVGWLLFLIGFFYSTLKIGAFSIFGIHTMMLLMLQPFIAVNFWGVGLLLSRKPNNKVSYLYKKVTQIQEDTLFYLFVINFFGILISILWFFNAWLSAGGSNIHFEKEVLFLINFWMCTSSVIIQILFYHIINKN